MNKHNFQILGRFQDLDKSEKFVFSTASGIIEITLIKNKPKISVFCLPTHHYCHLGCKFCHLTTSGNKTQKMTKITKDTMLKVLDFVFSKYPIEEKVLFAFMGVGEPFLNLELVFSVYKHFVKQKNHKISLALSSMLLLQKPFQKIKEQVKKNHLPLKIHFSLHSPDDKTRKEIIPSATTKINYCLSTLNKYQQMVQKDKTVISNLKMFHKNPDAVEIHYTMIENVNDSTDDLAKVIHWGKKYQIPVKFLKFNSTKDLKPSKRTEIWMEKLKKEYPAPVYQYAPPGRNIGSSCGQFTKHYYLGSNTPSEQNQFEAWKKKYQIPL